MPATPVTIGILSDTHLSRLTDEFQTLVNICFAEADIILHAGDLTDLSVLQAFADKEYYAVHGNMCRESTCRSLPDRTILEIGNFTIGLIHRAGFSYNFEHLLLNEFDTAVDCVVYGHTHQATCHQTGSVLYINPGSFLPTGRHGGPGSYALLTAGDALHGRICQVPKLHDLR